MVRTLLFRCGLCFSAIFFLVIVVCLAVDVKFRALWREAVALCGVGADKKVILRKFLELRGYGKDSL